MRRVVLSNRIFKHLTNVETEVFLFIFSAKAGDFCCYLDKQMWQIVP